MDENGSSPGSDFDSLKEDPEYLVSLLNKYVKVSLIKNTSFEGFVHSIDPVTHSVIISVPKGATCETTLIPGLAILDITEASTLLNLAPPPTQTNDENPEQISMRKCKLTAWLKKNLLPATEDGEIIKISSVEILPPYNVMSIYAENTLVAMQIRSLMEKMPDDFEPDLAV